MEATQDGERWRKWLGKHVAARGAGGRTSPADLLRELESRGFAVTASTVSRWLKGQRVGDAETAAAVGEVFDDRAGALRAAGYVDPVGMANVQLEGEGYAVIVFGDPAALERVKKMRVEDLLRGN